MARIPVRFTYRTGIAPAHLPAFQARLHGSWDAAGRRSDAWTVVPMQAGVGQDGDLTFDATTRLDDTDRGQTFEWGVSLVFPNGNDVWAIPTEVAERSSRVCHRRFVLQTSGQEERYYLTHCRWLGANKVRLANGQPGARFAVWAPHARSVEVVLGTLWDTRDPNRRPAPGPLPRQFIAGGYIADDGTGARTDVAAFPMRFGSDGVWETDPHDPHLQDYAALEHQPYMYRIVKDDGAVAFRTDLYSRCQLGGGSQRPRGPYTGLISDLEGTVSCSVVVDPDRVTRYFREEAPYLPAPLPQGPVWPELHFVGDRQFWSEEFGGPPLPRRIEDLIIYELHLGALGFGSTRPGTLEDAIGLLDHLAEVGVNAVELLPLSEFGGGGENWGYATSHYFAIEYGGGGRDQYKFFVREAHRRGIAVIMDVVYNHFAHDADRAESRYDSDRADRDIYYWYEGTPSDYPRPTDGFVDNMSTAYAPRYHEEMVRKLFISSAVALAVEFHVDGFRVDQTTSIHSYNRLHGDGREVPDANIFGAKLLRELGRTLRLVRPDIMLIAEDHSDWDEVVRPTTRGGMGFDARWYADFYHHLCGDTDKGIDYAKLLYTAAQGQDSALAMDYFAGALAASGSGRVVYSESHDEAGNSRGPFRDPGWDGRDRDKEFTSQRSIRLAVNDAPLIGATRRYAEARCRFAYGMTALSAGTPMFLFGEEVGAERRFKYSTVLQDKEDLMALRRTSGVGLFRFYQDVHRLRRTHAALRSRSLEVLHTHNANRVVAFLRSSDTERILVLASLNDSPFDRGYVVPHPRLVTGRWQEIFNSDATYYGGDNVGNAGATLASAGGIDALIPANGFVVLRQVG